MSKNQIKKNEVKDTWKSLKRSFTNAFMILKDHLGLTSTRILPSETPLSALSIILYKMDKEYNKKRDKTFNKALAYWFMLVSLHRYYTGSTEAKIDGDIRSVDKALEKTVS